MLLKSFICAQARSPFVLKYITSYWASELSEILLVVDNEKSGICYILCIYVCMDGTYAPSTQQRNNLNLCSQSWENSCKNAYIQVPKVWSDGSL